MVAFLCGDGDDPGCKETPWIITQWDFLAGKNRPLDEDDLQFVEAVLEQDRAKDRTVKEEERAELDAYQQVHRMSSGYYTASRIIIFKNLIRTRPRNQCMLVHAASHSCLNCNRCVSSNEKTYKSAPLSL